MRSGPGAHADGVLLYVETLLLLLVLASLFFLIRTGLQQWFIFIEIRSVVPFFILLSSYLPLLDPSRRLPDVMESKCFAAFFAYVPLGFLHVSAVGLVTCGFARFWPFTSIMLWEVRGSFIAPPVRFSFCGLKREHESGGLVHLCLFTFELFVSSP